MSIQQPPVVPVSLVKTEPSTVIKNEPPECEIDIVDSSQSEEKVISDVKDIDFVYHSVGEDAIKSEIVESKHSESVETQVLVKAENSPFLKTENTTQRNNIEYTSDEKVNKGTGQEVVEVQGSNKHSNILNNLETDKQHVLNFSEDFHGICVRSRKAKQPEKINFANCYKTVETTSWEKDKEKGRVIEAPVIPVEPHEYTSLAKDKHICNYCQDAFTALSSLRLHIKQTHRKLTTIHQCPYCPHKSKWSVQKHIIAKHKSAKDIQWFQCHLCEKKFKLKCGLNQHMKVHLTHAQKCQECEYTTTESQLLKHHIKNTHKTHKKRYRCAKCVFVTDCYSKFKPHELSHKTKAEMDDRDFKFRCDECDYKHYRHGTVKSHKLIHLKPEEIQYLYCDHCSYKSKRKSDLKTHIFRHHFKNVVQLKRHHCNKCDYKTYTRQHLNRHKLTHLKPEEVQYFYCYHCSYKAKQKGSLKEHIFSHHFKNVIQGKRHHCNQCDYKTYTSTNFKNHKLTHLKSEEIQYFYCYHCSYKAKRKETLKKHIFRHFKKEQVEFDCYICNFKTPKRESIMKHIKKHSKVQNKSEINEGT